MDERDRHEDTGTARKSGGDAWKTAYDVPLDMPRLLRAYERHKDGRCPWAGRAEAKTLTLALDTFRSMLRATARRHDVDEGHIRFGLMNGSSDAPACVIDVEETSAEYGVHGYLLSLVDARGGHLFVTPAGATYLGPSGDAGLPAPMMGWLGFAYLAFRKSDWLTQRVPKTRSDRTCPRPDPRQPRRRRTPEPEPRPAGFASVFKEWDMSEGDAREDLGDLEAPYEAPRMRGARDGRAEGREPQGDAKRDDPHKFPFSEWDMGELGDDEGIPDMPDA